MTNKETLAADFMAYRPHLLSVAYRMLGSAGEAEDAVQEAWLRLARSDVAEIDNLGGWLTTVVGRICLDLLRARGARREDELDDGAAEVLEHSATVHSPEEDALLAESVGQALMVVLSSLPALERVAFVLHDVVDLPFEEIAPIVGRSVDAARQLASRARRRVRAPAMTPQLAADRDIVARYVQASRAGDVQAMLAVLAPDVVLHADAALVPPGMSAQARGAQEIVRRALAFRGAAPRAQLMLADGAVSAVLAPRGRPASVLRFTLSAGRITAIDVIGDPARLASLEFALLPGPAGITAGD